MNAHTLIQQLESHPEPSGRMAAAHILGMVDEVDALPALYRMVKVEADPALRAALVWAGKRLRHAQELGYSTVEAIWQHFRIDREVRGAPEDAEPDLPFAALSQLEIDKLKSQMGYESTIRKSRSITNPINLVSLGYVGSAMLNAVAGPASAPGGVGGGLPIDLTEKRAALRRIMPTQPATTPIRAHVERLRRHASPDVRRKAAITLRDLNNLDALAPLAEAHLHDPDQTVRETARLAGKLLYLNAVYEQMEREGVIGEMIAARKRALGGTGRLATTTTEMAATPPEPDPRPTEDAIKPPSAIRRLAPKPEAPTDPAPLSKAATPPPTPDKEAIEKLLRRGFEKRKRP